MAKTYKEFKRELTFAVAQELSEENGLDPIKLVDSLNIEEFAKTEYPSFLENLEFMTNDSAIAYSAEQWLDENEVD